MYHTFVDQSTNSKKPSKKYVFVFVMYMYHVRTYVGCVHVCKYDSSILSSSGKLGIMIVIVQFTIIIAIVHFGEVRTTLQLTSKFTIPLMFSHGTRNISKKTQDFLSSTQAMHEQ